MSNRVLAYFDYETEKSPLHKIDPRVKFLYVIVFTCFTIYFRNMVPLLMLLGLILPFIFLGKFIIKWLKAQVAFIPLLLLIIILNAFLNKTDYATSIGIAMGLRFIVLSAVFGLYFHTVSPDDISQMFIKFRLPYPFAWAISTAYRFIPTLSKETSIIVAAQKSRGLQIDRGNIFKRARNMIPLLIPIFSSAMRRSWQLAEAIESRGWNAIKKRTYIYSLKFKWYDYFLLLLSLGLLALFLYLVIQNVEFPNWMLWNIPIKYELRTLFSKFWNWFKGLFSK
ncbi:MAG: energy-coupling factor transporter transmembrane protein EcfT [Asgard group archaeon]|nr:energy-coupling factor transporter transmembrane protein EcfT [Asgard group archaeon]